MIETTRLRITPLKYDQLQQYVQNDGSLEATLQLNPTVRTMSPELTAPWNPRYYRSAS